MQDFTEFEAKFYPVNKESYRKKLTHLGARLGQAERLMTRVIADNRANPSMVKSDYLRIRNEGDTVRLSYKINAEKDGELSDQKEIDVKVSDFEKTLLILNKVGIKFNYMQQTLREEWVYKNSEITIDTWPGLEPFTEIEAKSEEMVREIATDLGLDWAKKIITPTPEIYAMVYKMEINEVLKRMQHITFENNPFSNGEVLK